MNAFSRASRSSRVAHRVAARSRGCVAPGAACSSASGSASPAPCRSPSGASLIESGVRLRPRLGLLARSASRYSRTSAAFDAAVGQRRLVLVGHLLGPRFGCHGPTIRRQRIDCNGRTQSRVVGLAIRLRKPWNGHRRTGQPLGFAESSDANGVRRPSAMSSRWSRSDEIEHLQVERARRPCLGARSERRRDLVGRAGGAVARAARRGRGRSPRPGGRTRPRRRRSTRPAPPRTSSSPGRDRSPRRPRATRSRWSTKPSSRTNGG